MVQKFALGGTYVDPFLPGPVSGPDLEGYVSAMAVAFPDLAFAVESIIGEGDLVMFGWRMTGTNMGPIPGFEAATGRRCDLPGAEIIRVGPDGIQTATGYFDQKTFFEQLGMQVAITPAG